MQRRRSPPRPLKMSLKQSKKGERLRILAVFIDWINKIKSLNIVLADTRSLNERYGNYKPITSGGTFNDNYLELEHNGDGYKNPSSVELLNESGLCFTNILKDYIDSRVHGKVNDTSDDTREERNIYVEK